jgi:hypothetical protein
MSNSEFQTWLDCRRRWYISYYLERGIADGDVPITGALAIGTRVHKALERWYQNHEDPLDVLDELYTKTVHELLTREARRGFLEPALRKKVQSERELMHAMVEGYVAWVRETGADEGLRFAGAEVVVEVASGVPGVNLRGKLDKRVYREIDGTRLFEDFKTAADLNTGPSLLPLDEQMKFYMLLERLDAIAKKGEAPSEPTVGGLYTMLRKVKRTATAKPPFYGRVEIHHNDQALESMWMRTHRRIQEILEARRELDNGGDQRYWVYPHPTRDCGWKCPFVQVCPMMDDSPEQTWRGFLDTVYVHRDPYERYEDDNGNNGVI